MRDEVKHADLLQFRSFRTRKFVAHPASLVPQLRGSLHILVCSFPKFILESKSRASIMVTRVAGLGIEVIRL